MELGNRSVVTHVRGALCFDSRTFVYTRSTVSIASVDLLLNPRMGFSQFSEKAQEEFELYNAKLEHTSWLS